MNDETPWTWEQFVNKLKEMYFFRPEFDLVKHFKEIHVSIQNKKNIRESFKLRSKEQKNDERVIKKKIRDLEKSLMLLEKNSLGNQEAINTIKNSIKNYSDDLNWSLIIPQRFSEFKLYISRLCGIFYEGTGVMPIVESDRKASYGSGEDVRYSGNFYEFLLEAKPLLQEIGIELPNKYETLGKYAYQIVNGNKTEEIISFDKMREEIEINSIE